MSAPTRVGIIGAGSWAVSAHIPALLALDGVEVVGICRPEVDLARRIADDHGIRIATDDHGELLAAGLDAVIVASPAALHREHAEAALRAGAHVLCEKPMTIDPVDAWELVSIAAQLDRELMVSFGWNCSPLIRDAVALVERVGLGRVEHLGVHMSSSTRELLGGIGDYPDAADGIAPRAETWIDRRLSGGGYGQAQLSHALALAFAFTPERVERAGSFMLAGGAGVELHVAAAIELTGGGVASLSGASAHRGAWDDRHDLQLRIVGSEGQAMIDLLRDLVWVYRPDTGERRMAIPDGAARYRPAGPAESLIALVQGRDSNPAPGELGARTVEALDSIYRAAASPSTTVTTAGAP